jgi:filamentous hemagglutinin family protein
MQIFVTPMPFMKSSRCIIAISALITLGLTSVVKAGNPLTAALNAAATAQIQANAASAQAQNAARTVNQIGKVMTDGRVTLLQLKNATAVPSQVLRSFQANGKVYVINQNGIIFGAPRQIDTHALTTAAMKPANDAAMEEAKRLRGRKSDSVISAEVVSFGETEPKAANRHN